jgi:hypothetical protein
VIGQNATRLLLVLVFAVLGAGVLSSCGGSSSGSDQFRDQTHSPILNFGKEGSDSALEEGTAAVQSFFAVRAEGDWEDMCARLSRSVLDKIKHLATTATSLADTSCPSFLGTFMRLSDEERKESTIVDAGSLREKGASAYLIYYGGRDVVYAMALSLEDGDWKIDALSSKPLS